MTPRRSPPPLPPTRPRTFTAYRLVRNGANLRLDGVIGNAREEGHTIAVYLLDGSRILLRPQLDRPEEMPEPFELELVAPPPKTYRP